MKKHITLIIAFFISLTSFGQSDLTVAQAIEKALENNYQIKLVESNIEISQMQNTWGNAGMIPTFSLNLNKKSINITSRTVTLITCPIVIHI